MVRGFTRTFKNKHASFRAVLGNRGYLALQSFKHDTDQEIGKKMKSLAAKTIFEERRLLGRMKTSGRQWGTDKPSMSAPQKIANSLDYHMNSNVSVTLKSNPMPYGVRGSRGGKLAAIYEDGVKAFTSGPRGQFTHKGFQAIGSFKRMRRHMFERMNIDVVGPAITEALKKGRAQETLSQKGAQIRKMRKNQMTDYKVSRRMNKPIQKSMGRVDGGTGMTARESQKYG